MPPPVHLDPATLDTNLILVDRAGIQQVNPQRFEMAQLDAIIYLDTTQQLIAGYKDITPHEFWVRGHLPDRPLMPGVILCEAAAQLTSYYVMSKRLLEAEFMAFGGMDDVRFRSPVRVGDRLVIVAKALKIHRRQTLFSCQGFVGRTMAFHADVIGVPLALNQALAS